MNMRNEQEMAKAVTDYLKQSNIDPETVDYIQINENGIQSVHMTVILKPLLNCPYLFDIRVDI